MLCSSWKCCKTEKLVQVRNGIKSVYVHQYIHVVAYVLHLQNDVSCAILAKHATMMYTSTCMITGHAFQVHVQWTRVLVHSHTIDTHAPASCNYINCTPCAGINTCTQQEWHVKISFYPITNFHINHELRNDVKCTDRKLLKFYNAKSSKEKRHI